VTDQLAASLLGERGAVKNQVQEDTGCRLVFSNRNNYFPNSHYRILGMYSETEAPLMAVCEQVLNKIVEMGEEEKTSPPPAGPEYLGKESGEYVFRFCTTKNVVTAIIGPGGANIKAIRQDTGAKVFIENDTLNGHRMARVIGQPDNILPALARINEFIQKDADDPTFAVFAGLVNFADRDENYYDDAIFQITGEGEPREHREPRRGKGGKGGGKHHDTWGDSGDWASNNAPARNHKGGKGSDSHAPHYGGSGDGDIEKLDADLNGMPAGKVSMTYSIDCALDVAQIEALRQPSRGQTEDYFEFVKATTGSDLNVYEMPPAEDPDAPAQQLLTFVGSLPHIYTAHAMVMGRIFQIAEEEEKANQSEAENAEVLRRRIQELQDQLRYAQQGKA